MASKLLLSPDKELVFYSQLVDLRPHGAKNGLWNLYKGSQNSGAYRTRWVTQEGKRAGKLETPGPGYKNVGPVSPGPPISFEEARNLGFCVNPCSF